VNAVFMRYFLRS